MPSQPQLPLSAASRVAPSPVATSIPQSLIPAAITAALNRSVCPIAQAAMNPPWLAPPIPSRSGSATPSAISRSIPLVMSLHSAPPTEPATAAAKSRP